MGAIATLHRNALLSVAHPWSIYLGELAALLGLPTVVSGTGKTADRWAVPLASAGPLTLSVVAWNGQASGNAGDPQLLRVGLQAKLGAAPVALTWTSALFGADLPASGANHVTLFAEHDAAVTLEPTVFSAGAIQLAATSAGAAFSLTAGAAANVQASINGLSLTTPAGSITVPTLAFPLPADFDPANPQPTLGITAAELEALGAALLSLALTDALGSAGHGARGAGGLRRRGAGPAARAAGGGGCRGRYAVHRSRRVAARVAGQDRHDRAWPRVSRRVAGGAAGGRSSGPGIWSRSRGAGWQRHIRRSLGAAGRRPWLRDGAAALVRA
jgi:hypothetical protein